MEEVAEKIPLRNKTGKIVDSWKCYVQRKGYLYSKTVETEEEAARLRDIYILERIPGSHYKLNFSWTEEDRIKWKNKLD